ncbi:hypothetical protein FRC06_006926 [Ceratobasidium sp. 370]|nr:hypothetical protein FRC06_006926 [Ceratobasidium sp. 370]
MDWQWRRTTPSLSTRHQHEFRDITTWDSRSWRFAALNTPAVSLDQSVFTSTPTAASSQLSDKLSQVLEVMIHVGCNTNRWKTVHLNIASEVDAWAAAFFLSNAAFPNLESFTLTGHQDSHVRLEERLDTLTPFISAAEPDKSKLQSVHLGLFSMAFLEKSQVGTTVLLSLTCLEFAPLDSMPSVSQICQMLGDSPNLRIFRLTLGNDQPKQKDEDDMEVDQHVA